MADYGTTRRLYYPQDRVKPQSWLVDPAQIATEYRKLLADTVLAVPFWETQAGDGHPFDDVSPYHRSLVAVNGNSVIVPSVGACGPMFEFTGNATADRINIGSILTTDPLCMCNSEEMTFLFFGVLQGRPWNSSNPRIFDKSDGGSCANGWAVSLADATSVSDMTFWRTSSYSSWRYDNKLADGKEHSVMFRVISNSVHCFFDGVDQGSRRTGSGTPTFPAPSVATNAAIGNWNHTTDREFYGHISMVAIWDRALTNDEIALLASDPWGLIRPGQSVPTPRRPSSSTAVWLRR